MGRGFGFGEDLSRARGVVLAHQEAQPPEGVHVEPVLADQILVLEQRGDPLRFETRPRELGFVQIREGRHDSKTFPGHALTRVRAGLVPALDMPPEAVEDRLPAGALLFERVRLFGVERDAHGDAGRAFARLDELDRGLTVA